MSAPPLFATLWTGYTTSLINGSNAAASSLLNAVQPEITAALGLVVLICGGMMTLGQLDWNRGVIIMLRSVAIATVLQAADYMQWVQLMFLTTIPNKIVAALGPHVGAANVGQQFDALQSAVDKLTAVLLAASSGISPSMIADRIDINIANAFCSLMLVGGFFVALIAQAFTAIVAPVGVVMLIFYLFNNTRHFAERWIGKMVSLMVLQLFVAVLMQVVQVQFADYMRQAESASASGINLDEQILLLWNMGECFLVGALMLISLPTLAAAVGGSQVSHAVVMPIRLGSTVTMRALRSAGGIANAGATRLLGKF